MGARDVKNLILDHCSVSWSVDECLSVYRSENITVQWCMVTHSLSKSVHSKGTHGFGGIWGGKNASFHHNLLAHHSSRNPRFASDGYSPVDFRNNVVFNWGYKSAYGGGRNGKINFVANYYIPGSATSPDKRAFFYDPAEDKTSTCYISDNIMEGNEAVTENNKLGIGDNQVNLVTNPFDIVPVHSEPAKVAYYKVLQYAGCSFHRDSYDTRIINEVKTRTVSGGETYGGGNLGIIDSQDAVGGWPTLAKGTPEKDTDNDGIPDSWELANRLDPMDGTDGSAISLSKKYTNIEVYLNSILDGHAENFTLLKEGTDTAVISKYPADKISEFCKKLKPAGRILESSGYYVWGCSPIYGPDGKVHVFYSRWPEKYGMGGWIHQSEIAHAVADSPEGPYHFVDLALPRRPGYFDATTCHNPNIQYKNGVYYLFYMGTSDGSVYTKRIGLATSTSLYGPWKRSDKPILEAGAKGSWDDCNTTNPAFLFYPDGRAFLYYKSWNEEEYRSQTGKIRANRKYGLAIADSINGTYLRYEGNPIVDLSIYGNNKQVEDAFVFREGDKFKMLMRDMGFYDHAVGLIFESDDGLYWTGPQIAWFGAEACLDEPPAPKYLSRYGRFERAQLLLRDGVPVYMFNAAQGGKYNTSSGFVFKITNY
jgi:hypothetical protein